MAAWTAGPQEWAEIIDLRSRSFLNAQQVIGDSTHQIRVRYNSNTATISRQDAISFNGKTFKVDGDGINTDERNIELIFLAHVID